MSMVWTRRRQPLDQRYKESHKQGRFHWLRQRLRQHPYIRWADVSSWLSRQAKHEEKGESADEPADARGTYRNKALDEIVSFLVLGNQIEHVHARRQSCMIRIVFREGNSNASGLWVVASVDGIWKTEDFHNDGPGDRMKTYIEQQLGSVVPIRGTHRKHAA